MSVQSEAWEDSGEGERPFRLVYASEVQAQPGEAFARERWEYMLLEYVLSGKGTLQVGGAQFALEEGDLYILPPNLPHRYCADLEEPWGKCYMVVTGALAGSLLRAYGLEGHYFFPHAASRSLLEPRKNSAIEALRPNEETNHREAGSTKMARYPMGSLGALFCEILDLWQGKGLSLQDEAALVFHRILIGLRSRRGESGAGVSPLVAQTLTFIEANLEHQVGMADIAAVTGRSVAHLTRVFRSEVGRTPYEHLLHRRIEYACELLDGTGMAIKEIAGRLSYADAYYFSNAFKKQTGLSPLHYRQRQ